MSNPALITRASDWAHFAETLGLGENMLPCVPAAEGIEVTAGSALAGKLGKIPSLFDSDGRAHGITGWTKKVIVPEEIARWGADGRYNICIRTGALSGLFAIDIDIADRDAAARVVELITARIGASPVRCRANSSKCLIPLWVEFGDYPKQVIKTAHGAIEVLGTGQQFVGCGVHPSGVHYEWTGPDLDNGLPTKFQNITQEQFKALLAQLRETFSIEPAAPEAPAAAGTGETRDTIDEEEWTQLQHALQFLRDKASDNDVWSGIGYALLSIQRSRPARQLWIEFSRAAQGYTEGAPEAWWAAHEQETPRSDWRHILKLALSHGWRPVSVSDAAAFEPVAPEPVTGEVPVTTEVQTVEDLLPPVPDKITVRVGADKLVENGYLCEKLLAPDIFDSGDGRLVHIAGAGGSSQRADEQPRIVNTTEEELHRRLYQVARFEHFTYTRNAWEPCDCPTRLIVHFSRLNEWPGLRKLDGISQSPFMRPDGSICQTAGYDAKSRIMLIPRGVYPLVPDTVSREEALAARDRLLEPFGQFPFDYDATRSAFLAHILTEVGRLAMPFCPVFFYTAAESGSGKTLLADMAPLIAHGFVPNHGTWPASEEEMGKNLTAALKAGERSICLDNVPNSSNVRSAKLCAFSTTAMWNDRELGVTNKLNLPNLAVVRASGNAITPVSDMARRSIVIKLDAGLDQNALAAREFKIESLTEYVQAHRASLLVDALTVLRGHQQSGHSVRAPMRSFEIWSRLVRDSIIWLGMADPIDTQIQETDNENSGLPVVLKTLAGVFGTGDFTAADLIHHASMNQTLRTALGEAGCTESHNTLRVGWWLRDHRDKVGGPYRLTNSLMDENETAADRAKDAGATAAPKPKKRRMNSWCIRTVRGAAPAAHARANDDLV